MNKRKVTIHIQSQVARASCFLSHESDIELSSELNDLLNKKLHEIQLRITEEIVKDFMKQHPYVNVIIAAKKTESNTSSV